MEDFIIELAGIPLRIKCRYEENRSFFEGYFSEKKPEFTVEPTDEDLEQTQKGFDRLNESEGRPKKNYDMWFLENNALHILIADKFLEYNILMLHGSALSMHDEGIIFTAKSGTGKSTHARLWREAFGSKIQMINDDKPMINVDELKVYGTPWNGKHHLSSNTSVPLKSIVKIERAKENRISPLGTKDALKLLIEQTYIPNKPEKSVQIFELYAKLIENIHFYKLECNISPEAAQVAWKTLIGPRDAFEYMEVLQSQNKAKSYEEVLGFLEAKARVMNIPLFGQFELTPLCNLDCKMCYVHLPNNRLNGHRLLSADEWKLLIKQAFSEGMMEAALTGGECLTYPEFDDVYLFLLSLGCQVTIMTNGVLLDKKRIDFFKAHPPGLFQVTLYGSNEDAYERVTGHRVFNKVLENLKSVKDSGIPLHISITGNSILGEDIFETIRLARSLTRHIIISTSLFAPKGEEWRLEKCESLDNEFVARVLRYDNELIGIQYSEIPENELPQPGGLKSKCDECGLICGGGRSHFVINWKGEMLICNRMEAKSFPLRDGFSTSWKEINHIANNWPRVPECNGCPYEKICDKCAALLASYTDPGKRPEAYCKKIKYLASKGVYPAPEC